MAERERKRPEDVNNHMSKRMAENAMDIDFTKPWTYSDIIFTVEDKKLHASKMILCLWSPVFEAMFKDNFKEKHAKDIPLPDKKFTDVLTLLEVLHPPNKKIKSENVMSVLPLAQEYQMTQITRLCEDALLADASNVKNYLVAKRFGLPKLEESNLSYLKRCPVSRLKKQEEFGELDPEFVQEILIEKCEKFETHLENLREVRMVLERKRPTTFPGIQILCDGCTGARQQQVDCNECMKNCCNKVTEILRSLER